jgi:hypothetical protein
MVIESLKGMSAWPPGTTHELRIADEVLYSPLRITEIVSGKTFVVLLGTWGNPKTPYYHSEPCGVIPATPANLDSIKKGIALDYRAAKRRREQQ